MSEREGLYCEKHVKWCADGVCEDCGPAFPDIPFRLGESGRVANLAIFMGGFAGLAVEVAPLTKDSLIAGFSAVAERLARAEPVVLLPPVAEPGIFKWPAFADADGNRLYRFSPIDLAPRPCDHAAGYCKDTAHKYELPTTEIKSGVLIEMEMAIESGILEWPVADPEE